MSNYEKSQRHQRALLDFNGAVQHAKLEYEELSVAKLRSSLANERAETLRANLIAGTPAGVGTATGISMPWRALAWRPDPGEWRCRAGVPLNDAVVELTHLVRIIGEPVRLVDVNGADMVANLDDHPEVIVARWQAAVTAAEAKSDEDGQQP